MSCIIDIIQSLQKFLWSLPMLVILLGIWFIRGPKKLEPEENVSFIPPIPPAPGPFADLEKAEKETADKGEEAEHDGQ